MTGVEITTLIISLVSLFISIIVGYKTYIFSEYQLRLANRNEFQKLLIEIDKTLIEYPELWALYDAHPSVRKTDLTGEARLLAFAYMNLNVFECVFAFYADSPRLTTAEKNSFEAWKGYLKNTLEQSSFARKLVSRKNLRDLYHAKLFDEIDKILAAQSAESKQ